YEILCEFAHPNVGSALASIERLGTRNDRQGVTWVDKHFGTGLPHGSVKGFRKPLGAAFRHLARLLTYYDQLFARANDQADSLLELIQSYIRLGIRQRPEFRDLFAPYDPCPCGGDKKFKFCCRAAVPNTAESHTT